MKNVKIIVATHKKYTMPADNELYLPLHVGKLGKDSLGYIGDDTGDNISSKNKYYCELTGLYWAWKNLDADYIGLCHYRRYFSLRRKFGNYNINDVLNINEVSHILENNDVILPKLRKYYIENLYAHYKHTTYVEPLDETRNIIKEKFPEYLIYFNRIYKRTSAHMFNMFIMKKDILNDYCTWLFSILHELEKRTDISKYDDFHARFYGRISELLLDVYIQKNNIKYKEVKVISIEKISWLKKSISFLKAKFLGIKYDKSF